jgi:peptidyl-prolyl cis-trans isomerase D
MAVIGSIRKKSTLLVIVIGVALAAFVLGDFSGGGGRSREVNVGIVNGEEITIMDFNRKVDQNIEGTKQQQNKDRLTPEETFRLRNDTWSQMVSDIIYKEEYEALGLEVTTDEMVELIQGNNPHPLILQYFTNPQTGQFDRNLVIQYIQNLDNMPPESKQQWISVENYIRQDRLRTKYNNLIYKGFYLPNTLAKETYEEENAKASIAYVARRFSDVADSLISPTDDDYEKQYAEHKELFKQEPYRDIDYVVFDIVPSVEDLQKARVEMNTLFEEYQANTDYARFVVVNSDQPIDTTWKTEGQLPVQIDSLMFNSEVGTVAKPYMVSNTFYLSKLVEVAQRPDSLRASHILVSYQGALRAAPEITRTRLEAEQIADSLLNLLQTSATKIEDIARAASDDPSAQTNNGDLGWFADGQMVYNFNEAVINNRPGRIVLAETPFGFHVIKVTGKKEPVKKVKVSTVVREVIPSNDTYQNTFAKASKLAAENNTLEEFNTAVEDNRLTKRTIQKVHEMDNRIAGLNYPRQLIKWAFNEDTEEGTVSDVFDLESQFAVAIVIRKADEEYPPVEEVRTRLNTYVYNDLKGQVILQDIETLGNDFDQIGAQESFKKDEMNALTFSSRNIKGFGTENEIIGTMFGMNAGESIGPVVGKGGVFIVKLNNRIEAGEMQQYSEVNKKKQDDWKRRIDQNAAYRALEERADIEDNRFLFF